MIIYKGHIEVRTNNIEPGVGQRQILICDKSRVQIKDLNHIVSKSPHKVDVADKVHLVFVHEETKTWL